MQFFENALIFPELNLCGEFEVIFTAILPRSGCVSCYCWWQSFSTQIYTVILGEGIKTVPHNPLSSEICIHLGVKRHCRNGPLWGRLIWKCCGALCCVAQWYITGWQDQPQRSLWEQSSSRMLMNTVWALISWWSEEWKLCYEMAWIIILCHLKI